MIFLLFLNTSSISSKSENEKKLETSKITHSYEVFMTSLKQIDWFLYDCKTSKSSDSVRIRIQTRIQSPVQYLR